MTIQNIKHPARIDSSEVLKPDYSNFSSSWIRNPSWLSMPAMATAENKIKLLVPVDKGTSRIGFSVLQYANGYSENTITVDWGNNTSTTIQNSTNAWQIFEKEYDFNDTAFNDTNAPATISSSVITRNNHGYPNGYRLFLNDIAGPTNIYTYKRYHIVNATTNTFQISEEENGTPITINANGTVNLLPYKQAVVTITGDFPITGFYPYVQGTGSYGSYIPFTGANQTYGYDLNILQLDISCQELITFQAGRGINQSQSYPRLARLEVFNGYDLGLLDRFYGMFQSCSNLKALPTFNIPDTVVDMAYCFHGCWQLEQLPDSLNVENIKDAYSAFAQCHKLRTVPKMNFKNLYRSTSMFYDCYLLESVPYMEMPKVTDIISMFYNCYSLQTADIVVAPVDASNVFTNCYSLLSIPKGLDLRSTVRCDQVFYGCRGLRGKIKLDLPKAIRVNRMFGYCSSIEEIDINAPLSEYAENMFVDCRSLLKLKGTLGVIQDSTSMFNACYFLKRIELDISQIKPNRATSMFQNCYALEEVPLFDTSNIITAQNMFNGCYNLREIPAYTFTNKLFRATSMFSTCRNLQKINASIDFSNITDGNNLFSNCMALQEFPFSILDLSSTTTIQGLFYGCHALKRAPKVILSSACTSAYQAFRFCYCLDRIPKIDNFGSVTDIRYMFNTCYSLKEIPDLDYGGVTTIDNNTFVHVYSFIKFKGSNLGAGGLNSQVYIPYGRMSVAAINDFFTNTLADISAQSSVTINMTYQPQVSNATVSIATNKGWTVIG